MEETDKTEESERGGEGVSAGAAWFRERVVIAIAPTMIEVWSKFDRVTVNGLCEEFGVSRREDGMAATIVAVADAIVKRLAQ